MKTRATVPKPLLITVLFAIAWLASCLDAKNSLVDHVGSAWKTPSDPAQYPFLVTPELSHHLTLSCLNQTRLMLDPIASKWTTQLFQDLGMSFDPVENAVGPMGLAIAELVHVSEAIEQAVPSNPKQKISPQAYRDRCLRPVRTALAGNWETLKALFDTAPKADFSEEALAWQICTPNGYRNKSTDVKTWKFFSLLKLLSAIQVSEKNAKQLEKSLMAAQKSQRIRQNLQKIKSYLIDGVLTSHPENPFLSLHKASWQSKGIAMLQGTSANDQKKLRQAFYKALEIDFEHKAYGANTESYVKASALTRLAGSHANFTFNTKDKKASVYLYGNKESYKKLFALIQNAEKAFSLVPSKKRAACLPYVKALIRDATKLPSLKVHKLTNGFTWVSQTTFTSGLAYQNSPPFGKKIRLWHFGSIKSRRVILSLGNKKYFTLGQPSWLFTLDYPRTLIEWDEIREEFD